MSASSSSAARSYAAFRWPWFSHRSFGFHGPEPLIALIYLCAGGVLIDPPFTITREKNPI